MAEFRSGDIVWRVGAPIAELGVSQFERYEVADFDAGLQLGLQLVGVPGQWSPRGWLLLTRPAAH